jgi:predicted TIM-barrel fold metal-dependent hydrolase
MSHHQPLSPALGRREFLREAALGAAIGAGVGGVIESGLNSAFAAEQGKSAVDSQAALPIVDTHQHLWDLSKLNLPWTKGNEVLGKSFVMSDYLAATKGLNIARTVYMEVDVDPKDQVKEAEYVIDLCQRKDNPMVAAVISGRPASDGFAAYIAKFKGSPYIKGVRQVLHGASDPAGYCLDKQFVRSVQLLGEMGMSFDLCMRSGELLDGDKLVAQCPGTRFVVDHCGNGDVQETDAGKIARWKDGMKALAQRDNVVCKISGIVVTARKDWKAADLAPNMRFSMETFGPDRRMFAGDWPVCTLRASFAQWVGALKEIVREMGMSLADQKKLFHDNAVRFYALKDK